MPVRLLNSVVLRWPTRVIVDQALREWVEIEGVRHPELVQLGYFGSYARGDWGVGSDLDVVAIVDASEEPFEQRGLKWDLSRLPVPTEILTYTVDEWQHLHEQSTGMAAALANETVWLYQGSRNRAGESLGNGGS